MSEQQQKKQKTAHRAQKECGVYCIEHIYTGRFYIGSSKKIRGRFAHHRWSLRNGRHDSEKLQKAWTSFGEAAFRFRTLIVCQEADLSLYERLAISAFGAASLGFNTYANATPIGHTHGSEVGQKISASLTGRRHRPETIEKMRAWKRPQELKERISASNRGREKTPEHRQKLAAALVGRKRGPQSPETIAKRVAATKATKAAKAAERRE